jgi:hypothetical protein
MSNRLENNHHYTEYIDDVLSDDDTVDFPHTLFEEIANTVNLQRLIKELIDRTFDNDISKLDNQDTITYIHKEIFNICLYFVDSTKNYFRNMENCCLNIDRISPEFYTVSFHLDERITSIINNTISNKDDNINFDEMKNDIYNMCIDFSESMIECEKDIFQLL